MRPKRRPKTVRCRRCREKLSVKVKGPLPLYCRTCRQAVYLERRYSGPKVLLAQDLATAKVRAVIAEEVRKVLAQLGVSVSPVHPSPMPARPERRPNHLRVVDDETHS
jgi:hypothetical protein